MTSVQQYGWRRAGFKMPLSGIAGIGASQQQDASTVANSLNQLSQAAMKTGDPIVSAVLQAGAALANIVALFGPNPDNTITTGWVNQIEADVMKPNLAAWQSLAPEAKTPNQQTYALQVFTLAWNQIVNLCSNVQLGSAGTHCISDRQRGGKWDWWSYYYDPIAKDPQVAANVAAAKAAIEQPVQGGPSIIDTSTPGSAGGSNTPSASGSTIISSSSTNLYLWGGLALLAFGLGFVLTEND